MIKKEKSAFKSNENVNNTNHNRSIIFFYKTLCYQ